MRVKIQITFLSLLLLTACTSQNRHTCTISGKATNFPENQFCLIINEIPDTISVRADGTFSKDLTVQEPVTGFPKTGRVYISLYLEPGRIWNSISMVKILPTASNAPGT